MENQAVEQHELTHPPAEAVQLTAVLAALAEPARLTMVRTVASLAGESDPTCREVWDRSGLTAAKSTMSHHYKVLREAGIVVMWWVGAKKHIRLRRELMDVRWPGLLDAVLADQPAPAHGRSAGSGGRVSAVHPRALEALVDRVPRP